MGASACAWTWSDVSNSAVTGRLKIDATMVVPSEYLEVVITKR